MKYKLGGGKLDSHADIPDDLRKDLYAEAERAISRKRTLRAISPAGPVPVTINNHFPESSTTGGSTSTATASAMARRSSDLRSPVIVAGHHDVAVHNDSVWLQSRYHGAVYKDAIVAAERCAQERMLGLDHLYEDGEWQFLVDDDISVGIARRFVCDIKFHFKHLQKN